MARAGAEKWPHAVGQANGLPCGRSRQSVWRRVEVDVIMGHSVKIAVPPAAVVEVEVDAWFRPGLGRGLPGTLGEADPCLRDCGIDVGRGRKRLRVETSCGVIATARQVAVGETVDTRDECADDDIGIAVAFEIHAKVAEVPGPQGPTRANPAKAGDAKSPV